MTHLYAVALLFQFSMSKHQNVSKHLLENLLKHSGLKKLSKETTKFVLIANVFKLILMASQLIQCATICNLLYNKDVFWSDRLKIDL